MTQRCLCAEQEQVEIQQAKEAMRIKLLSIAGDMSTAKRQQLADGVFKPSYNMPTYTVEQAGIIELREVRSWHLR